MKKTAIFSWIFVLASWMLFAQDVPPSAEVVQTFSMIKPGAVKEQHTGAILRAIEKKGLVGNRNLSYISPLPLSVDSVTPKPLSGHW